VIGVSLLIPMAAFGQSLSSDVKNAENPGAFTVGDESTLFVCVRFGIITSLENFRYATDAQTVQTALKETFQSIHSKLDPNIDSKITLNDANEIVKRAFENAAQHGKGSPHTVPVQASVGIEGSSIVVTVSNPQDKPFPSSLQREFYPGETVTIPSEQRIGSKGSGLAVKWILSDLSYMPSGSSVRWNADGGTVTFTLRIKFK
jgi:hypothetical protein